MSVHDWLKKDINAKSPGRKDAVKNDLLKSLCHCVKSL